MPTLYATVAADRAPMPPVDRLYDAYSDFVFRAMRHLGVQEPHLEDAVQDVFVVAVSKYSSFEGRSTLRTWLYGIAIRVARNYRYRRDRSQRETGELMELEAPGCTPAEQTEQRAALRRVLALLEALPDEQRTVFVLAELEQLTAPEIAEVLGAKLNTVYSRLRLARTAFERALAHDAARGRAR